MHWRYALSLEDDLDRASRFVEFCEDNSLCHSLEFSRIILMAAAEAEVVAKQLANGIAPSKKHENMGECRITISEKFAEFPMTEASATGYKTNLAPWKEWGQKKKTSWWAAYTNIKHSRHIHYKDGNLINALSAISGLFIIIIYLCEEQAKEGLLNPPPRIFDFKNPIKTDRLFWNQSKYVYEIEHAT